MRKLLAALALYMCAWAVLAEPLQDGIAAALRLFRPLADQGDAMAQRNLGLLYDLGQGVPQDYVQAHKWYNLAAARAADKEQRDMAAKNRDIVAAKMTPAQVAEAQKLARSWR